MVKVSGFPIYIGTKGQCLPKRMQNGMTKAWITGDHQNGYDQQLARNVAGGVHFAVLEIPNQGCVETSI